MSTTRRTFLLSSGASIIAALPAFASGKAAVGETRPAVVPTGELPPAANTVAADQSNPVVRIDGWSAPSGSGDEMWLSVNQAWRGPWR